VKYEGTDGQEVLPHEGCGQENIKKVSVPDEEGGGGLSGWD
jgi:hypothetical protein